MPGAPLNSNSTNTGRVAKITVDAEDNEAYVAGSLPTDGWLCSMPIAAR